MVSLLFSTGACCRLKPRAPAWLGTSPVAVTHAALSWLQSRVLSSVQDQTTPCYDSELPLRPAFTHHLFYLAYLIYDPVTLTLYRYRV